MTLFFCMIVSSLASLACMPALVSLGPILTRRRRIGNHCCSQDELAVSDSIESQVRQTRGSVRQADRKSRRLVEVSEIVQEANDVLSIHFSSVDGSELPDFRPGQHLIIERPSSAKTPAASRCYTLSSSPRQKPWRITVRRQAPFENPDSVSAWVHREIRVGDHLRVRGPRGSFTLDKADANKPVVFIAAGVGITPMSSMLQDELSYQRARPKWLFYQVRQWNAAPLLQELVRLVEHSENCKAWFVASQESASENNPLKRVSLLSGKLDPATILKAIGTTDITIFLCGPAKWMTDMREQMSRLGVSNTQIHDEAFGPPPTPSSILVPNSPSSLDTKTEQFEVAYESSGKTAIFEDALTNLLAHAKANSIMIPSSCRTGNCGTCAVKLLRGTVRYDRKPEAELANDEILPCICLPTSDIGVQA